MVGDGAVGKTTLLIAHTYKCFSQDYIPTVLDNFATIVNVGSRPLGIGTLLPVIDLFWFLLLTLQVFGIQQDRRCEHFFSCGSSADPLVPSLGL